MSICRSKIVNIVIKIRISRCWEVCFKHLRNSQALSTTLPRAHLQAIPQRGVLLHSPCIYCRLAVQSCDITTRSFVTMLSNISNRSRYPSFAARLYGAACPLQSLLSSLTSVALICHCYAGFGRTTPSLLEWCAFASMSFTLGCVLKHSFSCTSHIYAYSLYSATGTETFCWSGVGGLWFWL